MNFSKATISATNKNNRFREKKKGIYKSKFKSKDVQHRWNCKPTSPTSPTNYFLSSQPQWCTTECAGVCCLLCFPIICHMTVKYKISSLLFFLFCILYFVRLTVYFTPQIYSLELMNSAVPCHIVVIISSNGELKKITRFFVLSTRPFYFSYPTCVVIVLFAFRRLYFFFVVVVVLACSSCCCWLLLIRLISCERMPFQVVRRSRIRRALHSSPITRSFTSSARTTTTASVFWSFLHFIFLISCNAFTLLYSSEKMLSNAKLE